MNSPLLLLTFKALKYILHKKPVFRFTLLKIKVLALDSIYILQSKKTNFLCIEYLLVLFTLIINNFYMETRITNLNRKGLNVKKIYL